MENMDLNIRCDDFLFANTSSSVENVFENPCEKIAEASETKAKVGKNALSKCDGAPTAFSISSSSSTLSSEVISQNYCAKKENIMRAPNLSYELAVAKTMMQQYSSISGDNLFDHLSDIIKRIIDERPPNVIDFFEEFSRSVREQKFHLPERFPADTVFEETRMFKVAKKQLISMKLPYPSEMAPKGEDDIDDEHSQLEDLKLDLKPDPMARFYTFNSHVQHLQFFWNQCGFSVSSEDIFQLACSMNRLQTHPSIVQCRFWGMINGLKASYYIVEASLSNTECESRLVQMNKEIEENLIGEHMENLEDIENVEYAEGGEKGENVENVKREKLPSHIGPELTPGAIGWENTPEEDLSKMKPKVLPVPLVKNVDVFDIPPEPVGKGVNRYSYFVVNSLFDDWIELPIVTPKQISLSRQIKKFFTGDLEEDVISYPCFCGKEKHYLRAMIARITAGTYIAPTDYYRKMTKKEKYLFEHGDEDDEGGEEEEDEEDDDMGEEEQDQEKAQDNDIILLKNEKYDSSVPLPNLKDPGKWVHVRPNILLQGRVVWYDQEKAEREREKERKKLEKNHLKAIGEGESESESDDDEEENDEEGEEEEDFEVNPEIGPAILTSCSLDSHNETSVPWTARFTSKFTNQNERMMLMQSNIWPGACTFIYKDLCESIYLGWGHKSVARNMMWKHFTAVEEEYEHEEGDFIESIDPSVALEQAYQLSLIKKDLKLAHTDFNEDDELESTEENDSEEEDD